MNQRLILIPLGLLLAASVAAPPAGRAQGKPVASLTGDWSGTLTVGGSELRLVVHFTQPPGGALAATLDSLDQGATGIPLSLARQTGDNVHLEASSIHATYDGTVDTQGDTIQGNWTQTVPLPLTLTRLTAATKAALLRNDRPQEPKPPYPYAATDVTFPGGAAGVTLAGTLTLPPGNGPFPAAILIAGSGPNDRDETILRHKLFLVLADSLTRRGIAVLRCDKRGIGKSTGNYAQATSRDFADDVGAAFAFLKARTDVDPKRIGLIGHSEGGLISPMVAVKSPDVAFLVLLAGTGVSGERIMTEQSALIGKAEGLSEADLAENHAVETKTLAIAAHEPNPAVARTKIQALLTQALTGLTPARKKAISDPQAFVAAQAAAATSPWFRFFLTYDPVPTLKQVRCPVLALDGSLDLQVPPEENLAAIGTALKAGGNTDVTTKKLPGLNHLFQTAKTGSPSEYGHIEETMAPVALSAIGEWVTAHTARQ